MTKNSTRTKRGNRVFKKASSAKSWLFMKQVKGRRYLFPLGRDLSEAKKLADQIDAYALLNPIAEVVKKYRPNGLRVGGSERNNATLADIIKRFKSLAPIECGIEQSTIDAYITVLKKVVKEGSGKEPERFYISDFSPALLTEFKRKRLSGVEEPSRKLSIKRTINSYMNQVRGVFSKKALKLYKDFDISSVMETLDDYDPFSKVDKKYRLPEPHLIVATHDLLHSLEDRPNQYIALALALHFGLRRKELIHAKRDWFEKVGERYRIGVFTTDTFKVKAGEDGFAFGSSVIAEKILNLSYGFNNLIVSNTVRGVLDPLLDDLRSIGWDRLKPLHECRKLYGSFWASQEGLYYAQKTLRHASPLTTNDYYADLIEHRSLLDLWSA
tara:strand:- start:12071 stop:13222 length:1152 start_codon:yes stop_codon:yes gene_type:complete